MRKFLAIINLLIALLVAIMVDVLFPDAFSNSEQYFLGIAIFAALAILELLLLNQDMDAKLDVAVAERQLAVKAWEARTDLDHRVQEVQRLLHQLDAESNGHLDLFYEYHKKKLLDLERSLRDACVKQEVQIDETMFAVTEWLLRSSMRGRQPDKLRAVLRTKDLDFFFDVHTRMYFAQVATLMSEKLIVGVSRLIVVDDESHLADERLQRLITFHNQTTGYSCQAIPKVEYDRIVGDYRLSHLIVDFGIYGDSYLYKGLTNLDESIVGIYSRDPREISQFTQCFESCLSAAKSVPTQIQVDAKLGAVEAVFGP